MSIERICVVAIQRGIAMCWKREDILPQPVMGGWDDRCLMDQKPKHFLRLFRCLLDVKRSLSAGEHWGLFPMFYCRGCRRQRICSEIIVVPCKRLLWFLCCSSVGCSPRGYILHGSSRWTRNCPKLRQLLVSPLF